MGSRRIANHGKVVRLLLAVVQVATAHSWVEQLSNVAPNGSFVGGHGYPRGFVDKGMLDFDQNANLWLVPPLERQPPFVTQVDLLCHASQRTSNQTADYPRLRVLPGAVVAIRYAENGHATIPNGGRNLLGKPDKGGTVFLFGTQEPRLNESLLDVLHWTRDGRGGDGRGILLAAQNFDDGRCYQLGNGAAAASSRKEKTPNPLLDQPGSEHELLCETDIEVPHSAQADRLYTMYWVWQWPTAPARDPNYPNGRDEYYTSCLDVEVVESLQPSGADHLLLQQDPMPEAVSDFRSRSALTTDALALYAASGFGVAPEPSSTAA